MNANKYKILWATVKDVLSIWMDSITFEYAFSTNERLISDHKNNLKSETIEALICSWDWLWSMYNTDSKWLTWNDLYVAFKLFLMTRAKYKLMGLTYFFMGLNYFSKIVN